MRLLGLGIGLAAWLAAAGCFRIDDQRRAASVALGKATPAATSAAEGALHAELRGAILEGSVLLIDYELRQQVDLTPESIGQYYQRFVDAARILRGFGWAGGLAHTFVRRSTADVPPTVTLQLDRFATPEGAARFLESLRRNESPSLSHFLDLAEPAKQVDQPVTGHEAAAFEAGLADRGVTPRVVPVRYYVFRRDSLIGQVIVVRDGPPWPQVVDLARAQDDRLVPGT